MTSPAGFQVFYYMELDTVETPRRYYGAGRLELDTEGAAQGGSAKTFTQSRGQLGAPDSSLCKHAAAVQLSLRPALPRL